MKHRLDLQPELTNVLNLMQPEMHQCRVIGYLQRQSLLVVEIIEESPLFYVVFPDVHYFDGVFLWQGANLRTAHSDEHFDYLLEKSLVTTSGLLFIFEGVDA